MSVLNFLNQIFIVVLPLAFITTAIWKKIEMKEHEGGKDNKVLLSRLKRTRQNGKMQLMYYLYFRSLF